MIEMILLLALALIWLVFAAISDWRTTVIPNWLNFSLIIFALGIRFFYSLFSTEGFNFFFQGVIGLGIFFVLGTLMYHGKMFAGGDKKLLIALGPILPFSSSFITNLEILASFLFFYLLAGSVYGIASSIYFALRNIKAFQKEFGILFRKNLRFSILIMILGIFTMALGLAFDRAFLYFGILVFVFPVLYIFMKSIDESCMVKKVPAKLLIEGDWLYHDVRVGKRLIKANWDGLTASDITLLKKTNRSVIIKRGIAFGAVFLMSFLLTVCFYFASPLWNSFW